MPFELHSAQVGTAAHKPHGWLGTNGIPLDLVDNIAISYQIRATSNRDVFVYDTTTSTHAMTFGNTTDRPATVFNAGSFEINTGASAINAFRVLDSSGNNFIHANTFAGSVDLGNTTTNPTYRLFGSGSGLELNLRTTASALQGTTYRKDSGGGRHDIFWFDGTTEVQLTSGGVIGGSSMQAAYDGGPAIVTDGSGPVAFTCSAGESAISMAGTSATTGLSIDGGFTTGISLASPFTQTAGSFAWTFNVVANDVDFHVSDNNVEAFLVREGTRFYFLLDTNSSPPSIDIGNIADDPAIRFLTNAQVRIQANTGDPRLEWLVTSAQDWTMGIDNSDSDSLKVALGNALGTDTFMTFHTDKWIGMNTTTTADAKTHRATGAGQTTVAETITLTTLDLSALYATDAGGWVEVIASAKEDTALEPNTAFFKKISMFRYDQSAGGSSVLANVTIAQDNTTDFASPPTLLIDATGTTVRVRATSPAVQTLDWQCELRLGGRE